MSRRGVYGGQADRLTRLAVYERAEEDIRAEKAISTPPLIRLALAAIGGVLLYAAISNALLAWLGAMFFMLAVCGASGELGAAAGAIAAGVAAFRVFGNYDGAGIFWFVLLLQSAGGAVAGSLSAIISKRLPPAAFAFLAALLPAGLEQLGAFGLGGCLASTALTQYRQPFIVCMGRLGGMAGVTYVVFLFGAAVAVGIRYVLSSAVALTASAPALGFVLLGLFYGALSGASSDTTIRATAFNMNGRLAERQRLGGSSTYEEEEWAKYTSDSLEQVGSTVKRKASATASDRGAEGASSQIVVWPEAAMVVDEQSRPKFFKQIEVVAKNSECALAGGVYDATTTESVGILTGSDGAVGLEYARRNFMRGADAVMMSGHIAARGTEEPKAVDTNFGRAGVLLSLDANDFSNFRAIASDGGRLVCVCGYDDKIAPVASERLLVFNAALSGMAVVSTSVRGGLYIIDPDGRIVASQATREKADGNLDGMVALGEGGTSFLSIGNAFAWLALAAGLGVGLYASSLPDPTDAAKGGRKGKHFGQLSYKSKQGIEDV